MLPAELIECRCLVALVAVEKEESVSANCSVLSLRLKHFYKLIKGKLVSSLAIITNSNTLGL